MRARLKGILHYGRASIKVGRGLQMRTKTNARGGALKKILNRYIHTVIVVGSQSVACNRLHHIEARLARWLLMSSDGVGSHEVNLTHEYLAVMLGVRRAGVSEAAAKLQEQNLIRYSRGSVQILDREGLEAAACECYCVVKAEYERLFD